MLKNNSMSIKDPLIHPALMDPRHWSDTNIYESGFALDRSPVKGVEHHAPDRSFALKHLKLDLRLDDDHQSISGSAIYTTASMSDCIKQFELDIAEMNITAVKLLRIEKSSSGEMIENIPLPGKNLIYDTHREKLVIYLDKPYLRSEQLTIRIDYSCTPRKGLFFIKPDEFYPDKPRQIWSQGQNEDSHWWFPCHDVTNQKMTVEMIATVNKKFFALSNGVLIDIRENQSENSKTFHWKLDQPIPAYLVCVAIGEYEEITGSSGSYDAPPINYYVYKNQIEEGRKLFENTPGMMKLFEEKFGHRYPYPKYSQTIVDDFLFGAMENATATIVTDRCLLDENAALDLNYDDLIAHELAHHWWGNLVTCKDWSHLWLNEAFATYSEYLWREHKLGEDEARFALFQDFLVYMSEDISGHRRPVVCNRYRFAEELMDRHVYEKGGCTLHMLRYILGDDDFFRSLSHYLNKFEHGTAETNDFKIAIEEATGQNLYWFFDQWLYSAGYPELEVSYEWQRDQKTIRLLVKQVQKSENKTPIFRFPVDVEIVTDVTGGGGGKSQYRITIEKEEQEFYFPCESRPRMVAFDKHNRIFKLMTFQKSVQELIYQLNYDEDVLGRVRASRDLSVYKTDEAIKALRHSLMNDDFFGVRMASALSLGEIRTDTARATVIEAYGKETDPRVRRLCVWSSANLTDEDLDHSINLTREFLSYVGKNEPSIFVSVAAIRGLANLSRLGDPLSYDILTSLISRTSWQESIASAVFNGLAQAKDKNAVNLAFEHSRYGRPTPLRIASVNCLGAIGKELFKEGKDERVVDYLIDLLKDKNIRVKAAAIRALSKIGNRRVISSLNDALGRECLDQLKSALYDAIESLEKN